MEMSHSSRPGLVEGYVMAQWLALLASSLVCPFRAKAGDKG